MGGTALAFAGNAFSFFAAALLVLPLLRLSAAPTPRPTQGLRGIGRDLREGLAVVVGSPILWVTILLFSLTNITLGRAIFRGAALPGQGSPARRCANPRPTLCHVSDRLYPRRAVDGALPTLQRRGLVSYGGAIVAGLGLALLGANLPLAVVLLAAAANGAALEVFGLIWTNILQTEVPSDKLGRVASFDMLGSFMLLPLGYGLTGWATEKIDPPFSSLAGYHGADHHAGSAASCRAPLRLKLSLTSAVGQRGHQCAIGAGESPRSPPLLHTVSSVHLRSVGGLSTACGPLWMRTLAPDARVKLGREDKHLLGNEAARAAAIALQNADHPTIAAPSPWFVTVTTWSPPT